MTNKLNVNVHAEIILEFPIKNGALSDGVLTIKQVMEKVGKLHPEENHDGNPIISVSSEKLIFTFTCINQF